MQLTSHSASQDTVQRGQQWYENSIRQQVDTEGNIGKIVAIDVATGEFVVGANHVAALAAMREKVTNPFLYFLRVGYITPTKVGGALKREISMMYDYNLHIGLVNGGPVTLQRRP